MLLSAQNTDVQNLQLLWRAEAGTVRMPVLPIPKLLPNYVCGMQTPPCKRAEYPKIDTISNWQAIQI